MTSTHQDEHALLVRIAELEQRVIDSASQLEAAASELEAVGAALSHDLRAPLRAIDGFSRLLMEPPHIEQLDPTGKDYLQRIHRAGVKLGQMMEDLARLVRLGRTGVGSERVDLSRLAKEILDGLQAAEPGRNAKIAVESGIVVMGNARLLRLALENLLDNAWKFTAGKDVADISFGRTTDAGVAAICVRDNGDGYEQKYADKLFRPFQRLHTESEFQGIGIGLATVRRVMHIHGGRVWARAQRGVGASFFLSLPGIDTGALTDR